MAKKNKSNKNKIWLILFLLISLIGLYIALGLVKKNQENRSQAGFAGDTIRSLCKGVCTVNIPHLATGRTAACNKMCAKIVFSCGTLASVDNIRSGVCYNECKVVLAAYSSITSDNVDQDCQNFCKAVISPIANFLKCTDEKCTQLGGQCTAPITAADGSVCTLKNGTRGTVQSNKCLSQESMNKKCCVPNSATPTPIKVNGVCGTTKNSCKKGTFSDVTDSSNYYRWSCKGSNGGTTASCSVKKTITGTCSSNGGVCIGNVSTCTRGEGGKVITGVTGCSGSKPVCCKL